LNGALDALVHASRCRNIDCSYPNCQTIMRLLQHASRCSVRQKNTLPEHMILSSANTRPPMMDKDLVTRTKKYAELSATEKIQADCDLKATNIIIQDLHTNNFDQLHTYLQQHELHANEVRIMRERNHDPLALVANHQQNPSHFNTYRSSYNNPQFQQQFSPSLSPQCGLIHPTQHHSTTHPSTPLVISYLSTPYPNAYAYTVHQDTYPQSQDVPKIEYTISTVNHQTHLAEFPQIDSGLAVLVFKQGDDLIDSINKMMRFLSTVVTSCFLSTNNQLRNSSNPGQQVTIRDERVTVQPFKGRPNSYVVVLLVEAQGNGKILNEEELEYLVDPSITKGPVTQSIITYNATYQADDLDAPMLYDGSVIAKETNVISFADSEETLMLEEKSKSKMLLKQSDPMILEKKVNIKPINYVELNRLSKDFGKLFVPQQELYDEQAFRLQTLNPNTDKSASLPVKTEAPRELPKKCATSVSNLKLSLSNNTTWLKKMRKDFCHNIIKNDLRKLKGKDIVDNAAQASNATTIALGMYNLDPVTLALKDKNSRETHIYYLRHTLEQAAILKEIVKQAKSLNPLDSASHSACKIIATNKVPLREPIPLEVVQIVLWYLDSGCSKHMTRDRSQLTNFVHMFLDTVKFSNDQIGKIIGQYDSDLKVAFRKHMCFVRNLEGVNLLSGSRETNLYTLSIRDMMASSLICVLSKASKTISWLWHRRLSHLNFSAINHLAKHGLVRGLPKLKFEKDHLCSACAMGKSKKQSHKPKDTNQDKLYLLHMGLCGPMRVESVNGKNNGTEFVNQSLRDYYEQVGISHETSVAQTPQQNGVVKRRNHTLIKAARTMLIYEQASLFLSAGGVATVCYTQNRSIIRRRHGKTPYELLHDRKPNLSYLHVFGALCYPNNDSENLGKFQAKADIGIFIKYAPKKKAYRIYNRLVVAPRAVDLADSRVSTSIDQDAPSTSIQSTQDQKHSLIISQGFEESPKTPHFYDDPLHESRHEDSTSQVSSSNVRPIHTLFESLGR
nr:hypothetical protein [Tanacetum cinerariifolium]